MNWQAILWPIRSRKVQVAIATLIVAYAAQAGYALSEDSVINVIAIGAALILGIAHEDSGEKSANVVTINPPADPPDSEQ